MQTYNEHFSNLKTYFSLTKPLQETRYKLHMYLSVLSSYGFCKTNSIPIRRQGSGEIWCCFWHLQCILLIIKNGTQLCTLKTMSKVLEIACSGLRHTIYNLQTAIECYVTNLCIYPLLNYDATYSYSENSISYGCSYFLQSLTIHMILRWALVISVS